jgi:hypothetical protein
MGPTSRVQCDAIGYQSVSETSMQHRHIQMETLYKDSYLELPMFVAVLIYTVYTCGRLCSCMAARVRAANTSCRA